MSHTKQDMELEDRYVAKSGAIEHAIPTEILDDPDLQQVQDKRYDPAYVASSSGPSEADWSVPTDTTSVT